MSFSEHEQATIDRVVEIMSTLEPGIHKRVSRMFDKEGTDVGVNVISNVASILNTIVVIVIENSGGDMESALKVIVEGVRMKYSATKPKISN